MAEEAAKGEQQAAEKPKKKGGFLTSTPFIIGVVAVVEAGIFFAASSMMGGGPEAAYGQSGEHYAEGEDPTTERLTVEVSIAEHFRIPNDKSGAQHLYDFDLAIKVAQSDSEHIMELIAARKSEILDHISRIVRGADPPILHEPALKTLRLKLRHMLGELVGDPEAIIEVLIPRCVPMRVG